MSIIEIDSGTLGALGDEEWFLFALAGEVPETAPAFLPAACAAPEAGEAGHELWLPSPCHRDGAHAATALEREQALGASFASAF